MKFFNLAFVSAFPGANVQNRNSYGHNPLRATSLSNVVNVNVGGAKYSLFDEDIRKHPGSFFEKALESESGENKELSVERDGSLFKFVNSFLVSGSIPRDESGQIALDDEILTRLKVEADFFGLHALSKECDLKKKKTNSDLEGFMTVRKHLNQQHYRKDDYENIKYPSNVLHSLKDVWAQYCKTGSIADYRWCKCFPVYKNSTTEILQMEELLATAIQSPFGRGTETVTDTSVRNSFEIPASELNNDGVTKLLKAIDVSSLAPNLDIEIRPYKLVIYKEGGHFHEHRDTVRGEGHIGTLVVILNSTYTGGELEVTHGGHTETVTGAYSWVAMYGDCLHKINPVTSGTRVSLIYDIYGAPRSADDDYEEKQVTEFWRSPTAERVKSENTRSLTSEMKERIVADIQGELNGADSLIITLQHLYPECQTSPAFLKGGDRALFDLLSEHYDVQVVATTINHCHNYRYEEENGTWFSLFNCATGHDEGEGRTKLLITNQFEEGGLLDYTPYLEYTGNESQSEETVYIVAGLQVRTRAV